ncbi:putative Germination protein, Ger(X)C family [Candidatus Desulfosporosinus infrequens]|uniref:Putative Germination protein, Ger(X)C family n=1 Tax=Candidatus Desulfosporosinus infrequens TaxID=2043169 RepID=A0A2U3LP95_9FIRM|nr:putative Germination protein, Ger(X)C family [Candidatus Desulfosporosinus infrequens]
MEQKKVRRFAKISLLVILLQMFCWGCWDQRDVNNLDIITVLGFDRITDEDGLDKWQVSSFVMQAGKSENTGGGSGATEVKPELVWRGKGLTIPEAILDFSKRSPRFPFFADTYSVIIGERAAKERLLEIVDYLDRLREYRPGSFVMIAKGDAAPLFETEPEDAITVSRDLKDSAQNTADSTGIARGVKLMDFTSNLLSTDRDPVAPEIKLIKPKEKKGERLAGPPKAVLVEGLAVFKDDKWVGWLNKEEAVGYDLLTNKINKGDITIRAEKAGEYFTFLIEKSKPTLKATLNDEKLNIKVGIDVKGRIIEDNGVDLAPGEIDQVEHTLSEQIGAMAMHTIETVRGYGSDCLGFSEELHRYSPNDWKKIKSHWRDTYLNAKVDVEVNVSIENTGRLGQRLEMKK